MKIFIFLKKLLWRLGIVLLCLGVLNVGLILAFPKNHLPEGEADSAIVLGAAPGSLPLLNRTTKGVELVQVGKTSTLVLSGGKSRETDKSEADYMKKIVSSTRLNANIILEGKSSNTWENLKFTAEKIDKKEPVIIVTDEYHIARSVITAKFLGYTQVFWSSPDSKYYPSQDLRRYYAREMVALPWYLWLLITGKR